MAAAQAAARGLPIDFRVFSRGEAADIAVESLDLPDLVDEREAVAVHGVGAHRPHRLIGA